MCYLCKRLTHDQTRCPFQIQEPNRYEEEKRRGSIAEHPRRMKGINISSGNEGPGRDYPSKRASRGVEIHEPIHRRGVQGGRGSKGKSQQTSRTFRGESRKGKGVAEAPQLIWKQKGSRGGSGHSKSSQESAALSKGSGEHTDSRGTHGSSGVGGYSKSDPGSDSVFKRLSGLEAGKETEVTLEDLREKLSEARSGEKQEGRSSKGSRSPPSVFERLGRCTEETPREKRTTEGSYTAKRRRLSSSDERNPKKMRKCSNEKTPVGQSVFHRLGEASSGSAGKGKGVSPTFEHGDYFTPIHSAQVAATVPDHSVRRIALASGNKKKEGLMVNTNPSKSL